ncbi:MAG: tyrosine-type recombinase/integrase [Chthoniobacteraceae bacterium]|nr:tyrosine-type recombinase/integrase [Chthoniobacteraceae bacterium]
MSKNPKHEVPKQTRDMLEKIASIPCLYRHSLNRNYYGIKKHAGKIVKRAFKNAAGEPITSLQEAKVALAGWIASLGKKPRTLEGLYSKEMATQFPIGSFASLIAREGIFDAETGENMLRGILNNYFDGLTPEQAKAEGIDLSPLLVSEEDRAKAKQEAAKCQTPTLAECFEQFIEMKANKKEATLAKYKKFKKAFELNNGKPLLLTPIGLITTDDLSKFYVAFAKGKKPRYFNTFSIVVNQVFEMARVNKGYIEKNPLDVMNKDIKRLKVSTARDNVPTIEQCEAIVKTIREKHSKPKDQTADMTAFLHLAALGEAEAISLQWRDIDFEKEIIRVTRIKTSFPFDVPMYPHLKPFLVELAAKYPNRKPEDSVFQLKSVKKPIYAACKRLKYSTYSPRDLRKARITWFLRKNVAVEQIAKWQGHRDKCR